MTYQEIKDRLSKCELTLEKLKSGNTKDTIDTKDKINKLSIIKESYVKLLKEAEKTAFINGQPVEYEKEDELKKYKDNSDVKSIKTAQGKDIKEQEGTKFSVDETKSIAKSVGKAVAKALKSLGDEVAHMKAKKIEENSFDIYVQYKNDAEDEFSFYIVEDSLHLTDFSFDKELTDVGVKPSGEAIVNVDVLANELTKHFKAMNEKVDSKDTPELKKLSKALKGSSQAHLDQKKKLDKLINTEGEVSEAPEGMYYIKISKDAASQNKAQVIFNDLYDIDYELNDDPDGVVMYFKKEDFDAGVLDDLEGDGVHILDTNIPNVNEDAEEDAKNDADYEAGWHDDPRKDEGDDENTPAIDRMYNSDAWVKAQQDAQENKDDKFAGEDPKSGSTIQGTGFNAPRVKKEDTDVGHQDDEPGMLKSSAMETAEYAAKLYKKLDKYDQHDGEVDFPNWWQKKLILAREYMSAAYHYLDSEEKQPALDQLALESVLKEGRGDMERIVDLITDRAADSGFTEAEEAQEVIEAIQDYYKLDGVEENVDKVAGGIPYRQHGNKVIISEPLDDATKERLLKKAKEHGYFAQPNQAGGITITLKGGMNEVDNIRFIRAAFEDLEQVIRNLAHTAEISEDEALEMAIRKLEAMLDGRDDMDEGRKDNDALYADNPRLSEIKNLADKIISMVKAEADKGELGYIKTMEEIRYQQEHDFERTPEWNKAKGIRSDFDDYGSDTNEGDDDLDEKKNIVFSDSAYDMVVHTMKRLAKKYKAGDKSVIPHLKKLTHIKKQLEKAKIAKAAKIGQDQELETDTELREAGPGFKHDCAAKVIHKEHGAGNTIPEKHTLVKEGKKYVVTHYDVLFENGKTVKDIPVNELDVKTTNEHWHKGYKKKKK